MPLAAADGFSFASPYAIGFLCAGLAVWLAVGALSHQGDRAFSASLIYLGLGIAGAAGIGLLGLRHLDPIADNAIFEHAAEFAVIVALFGTGLKLERALTLSAWSSVVRLLAIAMPLTIGAVALFGVGVMGLSVGAAIALGACLAPTDPVLAGDVGVGPPGEEEEREPNFSLTGEAGLNDGLAYPFLLLGAAIAAGGGERLVEWALADVLWGVAGAVLLGGGIGWLFARLMLPLRERQLFAQQFDGWIALSSVLFIYGACEVASVYGFLGAFVGGVAFRRYEHGHEYHRAVHDGAEQIERFSELALILLLGTSVTLAGLQAPGSAGWLLVAVVLLAVRPLAVLVSLVRAPDLPRAERTFVAWFGVRGIGSLYYAAVVVGLGVFSPAEERVMVWTVIACVITSIVVHGVTASPLGRRLVPARPSGRLLSLAALRARGERSAA